MENSTEFEVAGKKYVATKFRPTVGRRIVAGYPITMMPKVGNYDDNEALMVLLMSHVSVVTESGLLPLTTIELINNHVPSWENLVEIEYKVLSFNCPFMSTDKLAPLTEMIKTLAAEHLADTIKSAMVMMGISQK